MKPSLVGTSYSTKLEIGLILAFREIGCSSFDYIGDRDPLLLLLGLVSNRDISLFIVKMYSLQPSSPYKFNLVSLLSGNQGGQDVAAQGSGRGCYKDTITWIGSFILVFVEPKTIRKLRWTMSRYYIFCLVGDICRLDNIT